MGVRESYNSWADQYDTNLNKTRDLEGIALREMLGELQFDTCLEIGCGTGKNSVWLIEKAKELLAVDLSEEMLAKAKAKIASDKASFQLADINQDWSFVTKQYDLISFSLVLEHIEHLDPIFEKAAQSIVPGGFLYVGELHPFKQYTGTKARFETTEGVQIVSCFNHHISDFTEAAKSNGFELISLKEFFDDNNRSEIPRIITLLFQKTT